MNTSPNLTFKQQRFIEEYQVDGNGSQAVLRAGYKTNYPAEMAYVLLRNTKVKHTLRDAQNTRRERLEMRVDSTVRQYIELKEKALAACDYQISLRALNQLAKHLKIFEHYHAAPLLEAFEKDPDNLNELVDQFLWINTSLGNWSYVLRALEFKVKLAGEEKEGWDYEKMLSSLELAD
ncbi:MAG: terminase small subunit [Deltaproteobacteria bacterium]|nr:terminase small subunit [Deltaproteobacteria bacterium]